MPDTLTPAHLSWTQKFTGVDLGMGADGTDGAANATASDAAGTGGAANGAGASGGTASAAANGAGGTDGTASGPGDGTATDEAPGSQPPAKKPPPPAVVVGPMQAKRAQALLAKLSADDQKKYQDLLTKAKSDKEKAYLTKGLASGHSVSELQAFEAKIAGKDEKWMQDNLSLTGDSNGKGVKQQWMMSCNATAVEAVRGELDPLYALKMHEDSPNLTERDDDDPTKKNPKLAADQQSLLETKDAKGYAGKALAVNKDTEKKGRWNTDLLNNVKDSTGVEYANKKIGTDTTVDQAVDDIAANADKKIPVPIVVGASDKNYAHYVIVVASDPGPPRMFQIHDPATGTTVTRSEDDLKKGKIDIGGKSKGLGYMKLSAYEKPTPVEVK